MIKIVRSDQIILEPFDIYASILADSSAKMRDQTSNVRKNALKLFSTMIQKFATKSFDLKKFYNGKFPSIQSLSIEKDTYVSDLKTLKDRLATLCEGMEISIE